MPTITLRECSDALMEVAAPFMLADVLFGVVIGFFLCWFVFAPLVSWYTSRRGPAQ